MPQPEYFSSLVGWAMWHLSRGDSLETVEGMLFAHGPFQGISQSVLLDALSQASINNNASQMLQGYQPNWLFLNVFPESVQAGDSLGVRIVVNGEGIGTKTGMASITVNVRAGMSVQAVLDRIEAMIASGQLLGNSPSKPTSISSISIAAVYEQAFTSPTVSL